MPYQDNTIYTWPPGVNNGYRTPTTSYLNMSGPGNQAMTQQAIQTSYLTSSTSLPGRVVNSEADIVPNEVPMDGNVGFFVQNDLQRIYAKTWGRDGTIHTNIYELISPGGTTEENTQNGVNLILERLDKLEQSIKKNQGKPHYNKNRKPKQEGEKQV